MHVYHASLRAMIDDILIGALSLLTCSTTMHRLVKAGA